MSSHSLSRQQLVISREHASNRLPAGHGTLGLPRRRLGVHIPYNIDVFQDERRARIRRYYEPYRRRVLHEIEHVIDHHGTCLHLSAHTFTSRLEREPRHADIGMLHDPRRQFENAFARRLSDTLKRRGHHMRRNYPYRGTSDGFTTYCRRVFPASAYLGIEIELNQAQLERASSLARSKRAVADCVYTVLLEGSCPALTGRPRTAS